MLGHFQQSSLRIELDVSASAIEQSLLEPEQLQKWIWPQQLSSPLPNRFQAGMTFSSWLGPVSISHCVELVEANRFQVRLSQGIDGFYQWSWGDGWVQSQLEGVSLLPLNLSQSLNLLRLRQFLRNQPTR